jgi:hypothetical protein
VVTPGPDDPDDPPGAAVRAANLITIPGVQKPHWLVLGDPLEGGHLAALEPADGGDARHPWGPVDPHRAATALALGAAPVLDRAGAYLVAQDVEQRQAVVGDLDVGAVDAELDQWLS